MKWASVKEAGAPRHEEQIPLVDAAIEKWLAGPANLDHPAVVLEHRLKDPQAFASRDHALRDHPSDHRPVHAGFECRDRRDGRRVFIAMRAVKDEVAGGHDP